MEELYTEKWCRVVHAVRGRCSSSPCCRCLCTFCKSAYPMYLCFASSQLRMFHLCIQSASFCFLVDCVVGGKQDHNGVEGAFSLCKALIWFTKVLQTLLCHYSAYKELLC